MVDQNLWEGRWCSWHSVLPSARGVSPDEVPVKTLRAFSPRLSCQTVARRMRSRKGGSRAAAGRSSCVAAPLDRPPGTAFAALYRVGLAGPARTMISTTVARCHDRSRVVGIAIAIDWQCPQSLVLHPKCRPCGQRHRGEQVRVDTTDSAPDNVWRLMKYRTSSSTASSGATDRTRHAPRSRLQRRLPETSSPTIKNEWRITTCTTTHVAQRLLSALDASMLLLCLRTSVRSVAIPSSGGDLSLRHHRDDGEAVATSRRDKTKSSSLAPIVHAGASPVITKRPQRNT